MSEPAAAQQDEVRELIEAIHQDRINAKEKEKRESWTKYVSLMIVILAVVTAIGSLKAGGFSSKVLISQSRASDSWSYFQAKSIKRNIAEMESRNATAPEAQERARAAVERYRSEEADIKKEAQGFEAERDGAAKHGPPLGFGIACLQIAIAIASVCLITKKRLLWAASGFLGVVGVSYVIYGLYLV
jgi:hypothetical protein